MNSNVEKKLDAFFGQYKNKIFQKNDLILNAGEQPDGLYYLKEGVVRQYAISPGGDELTINVFKSASLFPIAWVISDSVSPHFFEAVTPVTLWVAPKKESLSFLQSESSVLFDLIKRIYSGLDGYFTRIESLLAGNARTKLITQLVTYAKRFGVNINGRIDIPFVLTHKELAAQSGIARETVSRELIKLKAQQLIKINKNSVTILSIAALEAELVTTDTHS